MRRGQTLALFSLTVLLVALMVLMTLSLGAKIRDRMDLQTVADAAAYSNAIATARTMNQMSVMNRAMIAHAVSTIGAVSLISYATLYYMNAKAARELFAVQLAIVAVGAAFWCALCGPQCPICCARCRACIQSVLLVLPSFILMSMHASRTRGRLAQDIQVYQRETFPRFQASAQMFQTARGMVDNDLRPKINGTGASFAGGFLGSASLSANTSVLNPNATTVNENELQRAFVENNDHTGWQPWHAGILANGSRGHPFVQRRSVDAWEWSWDLSLPWSIPNGTYAQGNSQGRGYVNAIWFDNPNSAPPHGHPGAAAPGANGLLAHDNGNTVRTLMIPQFIGALVTANSSTYYTCTIFGPLAIAYGLMGKRAEDVRVSATSHSGIHSGLHAVPNMTFPSFFDFNADSLTNPDDLNGQPRNVSVVSKTPPPVTTNPWDIKVGINQGGRSAGFDMTGGSIAGQASNGRQVVLGAGVTYYSRPGHQNEPPNMFAPYWHATLGRLTIDRPGPGPARGTYDGEVMQMLNASQPESATAYQELTRTGFLGLE